MTVHYLIYSQPLQLSPRMEISLVRAFQQWFLILRELERTEEAMARVRSSRLLSK
jgi:hypothetical protein